MPDTTDHHHDEAEDRAAPDPTSPSPTPGISRRSMLMRGGLLAGAGVIAGGSTGGLVGRSLGGNTARQTEGVLW